YQNQPEWELDGEINLREEMEKYLIHWKWFVLGLLLALAGACLYLRYAVKQYNVEAKILLTEESNAMSSELEALQDLSILGDRSSVNIQDQIEVLKSRRLMRKVVDTLQLHIRYFQEGRVKVSEMHPAEVPFRLVVLDTTAIHLLEDKFDITLDDASSYSISKGDSLIRTGLPIYDTVAWNSYQLALIPRPRYFEDTGRKISVQVESYDRLVNRYLSEIMMETTSKDANVIRISLTDPVKAKAEDIVNELIHQYNHDLISDKQVIGEKTLEFISNRLEIVGEDLQAVDRNMQSFKSRNDVTNVESEAGINLQRAEANETRMLELSTQLSLVDFMNEYLDQNQNDLIPSNIGLDNPVIAQATGQYNQLVLERNRMLQSSTEANPRMQTINAQLADLRQSLRISLRNYQRTVEIALGKIESQRESIESEINRFPAQERDFRNIVRQQEIVESLYLFLLQKREETEISNAATPVSIKIIDEAYGSNSPVSPKTKIIYLAALLLGFLVPFGILYLRQLLDNKLHNAKDIEKISSVPIIGQIPNSDEALIQNQDRSAMAESFRILRTNIRFFLTDNQGPTDKIFITSTISGEGKTFVTLNLARILSMTSGDKRVLIVEADIRKPKIAKYLKIEKEVTAQKGLTHYLMDHSLEAEDVILESPTYGFDMVLCGLVAPNPSELMMNGRFTQLMQYAEGRYD